MARRHYKPRPKKEDPNRINRNIRVPEIRLVGDNLEEISNELGVKIETGIYPTRRAQEWAEDMELDLVEISPNARPPVCKITDYKKYLYLRKKREKEIKSKTAKTVIKEIRFGPNTDSHDFEFKMRHAINFLEEGAKVKAYVHFKGRTIVYKERGKELLLKFINELAEHASPEGTPRMEGRRMHVILAPHKDIIKKK